MVLEHLSDDASPDEQHSGTGVDQHRSRSCCLHGAIDYRRLDQSGPAKRLAQVLGMVVEFRWKTIGCADLYQVD